MHHFLIDLGAVFDRSRGDLGPRLGVKTKTKRNRKSLEHVYFRTNDRSGYMFDPT